MAIALRLETEKIVRRVRLSLAATAISIFCFVAQIGTVSAQGNTGSAMPQLGTVRVDDTPGHSINSFDPDAALGSSIDVLSRTDINKVYTPHIIQEALSAGWGLIRTPTHDHPRRG